MFLNSIFSGIKRGSSMLGLATSVTSATTGAVTSYYLFRGSDIKSELDKLNSKLEETKQKFVIAKRDIKTKGYASRAGLMRKGVVLKKRNECLQEQMKKHDENYGAFGSWHTADIDGCRTRHFFNEEPQQIIN